jgi:GDPmannose 4,6-dehydratase
VQAAFEAVGLEWREHVIIDRSLFRPTDIAGNAGDPGKAEKVLRWRATVRMREVVSRMMDAEKTAR